MSLIFGEKSCVLWFAKDFAMDFTDLELYNGVLKGNIRTNLFKKNLTLVVAKTYIFNLNCNKLA